MSAAHVQSEILDPMQRLFLPPRQMAESEQSGALREYVSALEAFEATDLNTAWCAVRDTHTTRSWPVPAAFIMAARQARKYRTEADQAAKRAASPQSGAGIENTRWEVWKAVCRSPLGREAVRMNVAWALRCAVLHDGLKPEQIDLRELRLKKNSAERTAEKIENGEMKISDRDAGMALRMWRVLLTREVETQAEINFGVVA